MKTERLKCPNCGSTEIEIISISEITLNCLLSLEFRCKDCKHEGKISVRSKRSGKVEILFT